MVAAMAAAGAAAVVVATEREAGRAGFERAVQQA